MSGDLREGGTYQLEGNAGGTVERCTAPESFAVTWEYGGTVSWLEVTLTEADGGTTLELVHEAPVDPEFWALFGPGAVGLGWDLGLLGLGMYVEIGRRPSTPPSRRRSTSAPRARRSSGSPRTAGGTPPSPTATTRRWPTTAADGAYAAYTVAPEE